jgi:hypothetical protein
MGGHLAKDQTLKIRLTPSELDAIKKAAKTDETTVSALVRAGLAAVINRKPLLSHRTPPLLPRSVTRSAGLASTSMPCSGPSISRSTGFRRTDPG